MSGTRRKPIEALLAERPGPALRRVLGPWDLIALGIGCSIGAGLFSLTGLAAAESAGPAIVFSYLIAAIGCGFAGLCYSELASMIPVCGSAYSYTYAAIGELVAWIVGWDLILEYAVGAATVARSWSHYLASLLRDFGVFLLVRPGFDLPAVGIVVAVSLLLMRGISASARVNAAMVVLKLGVIVAVIGFCVPSINGVNYIPFVPPNAGSFGAYGWSGVLRGAGAVFFAYVGFDAVSTAGREAKRPDRDMPVGILGSLAVCTLAYVLFAFVLTGLLNYRLMRGDAAPVASAIALTPYPWLELAVKFGILCGFTSVLLVLLLGQSRIFYAIARDGLLPRMFCEIHPRWQTPWQSNLLFMGLTGMLSAFLPIRTLSHMTSIGTLLAFLAVCVAVLVLRVREPRRRRPFKVPGGPVVPILGIATCLTLMASLDALTWVRLGVWLLIGLAVYVGYGRSRSRLAPAYAPIAKGPSS